jgi:hypothetical protein
MTAATTDKLTAPVLSTLESTWAAIRRQQKDLPAVAFVIGAGSGSKDGSLTAGHFAPGSWADDQDGEFTRHEVFIAGELLKAGPTQVLATMLHEAAHALAHVRKIQDTSRGGRFHNARFKALAEDLGLSVEQTGSIGWSATSLTPAAAQVYAAQLVKLGKITAHRRHITRAEATGRKSSNNGVAASCPTCGRKIRMSRSVNEAGPIVCWPCFAAEHEADLDLTGCVFTAEAGEDEDA